MEGVRVMRIVVLLDTIVTRMWYNQLWRATVAGKTDSHILLHYEDGENHQHAMNESLYLVAFDDHELFKEELGRNLSQHVLVSCW